ncbi:MAG: amino acid adenylation domain-containing protein [Lysobacteraceae bacterium]
MRPGAFGLISRHLAYVIYTSGTTGTPKGVMVEHASVTARAVYGITRYAITPQDRCLQFASFGFDASVTPIFSTLAGGAALIVRGQTLWSPDDVAEQIGRHRITIADVPTSYLEGLLTPDSQRAMRDLRILIIGGEAALSEILRSKKFDQTILNEYGPTEATVAATNFAVPPHAAIAHDTMYLPIGRPISNTSTYLLDERRVPVPIGVVGELYIGGCGVARGYLNQPGLTSERFLDDPFSADPAARMYKTGDLGRWMADGNIEYLGRNDFQVKIRGFRIELGEIEAALAACEGVREAVVIARDDGPGEKHLVAYYLGDRDLSAASLREQLAAHLPAYMVPVAFVSLLVWPLTTNGKLDRRALPAPEGDAFASRTYEAPVGEVEQALATIWAALLKLERVGRHDNFFELGGHSLLAVQLVSRFRSAFNLEVPLRELFDFPVLSQLALRLDVAESSQLSMIGVVDHSGPMPLSLSQQRLWILTQIDGASAASHMGGTLRLSGTLNRPALERGFQRIVDRHEALRTQFVLVDGQPMQVIMAEARIVPCVRDLRGQNDRERICRESNDALMASPFDLRHDLPLRVQLIRLEDDTHELQVVMHHIVSDGWSIAIMLDELSRLYAADIQGQADPLPVLPIQYADYAVWQRQWLAEGQLTRQIAFWQRNLAGAPTLLELPTDRRRPAQQDFLGDALDIRLDAALTADLNALSQRHGVTLYMTLLASWAAVLGRLSNQDEVVIGSPVAGRNRAEIESLIGFFVNTIAFRIDLSGEPTMGALLARTQRQVLDAQAHQDLPFDQVVDAVKPLRSMGHSPIFQAMLAWQNQAEGRLEMPGMTVSSVDILGMTAQFDLTLNLGEFDGEIAGVLNYATALFDRETVERYAGYWRRLLFSMVGQSRAEASTRSISTLPILSADERALMLDGWNDSARDYPLQACVHQLFEAQVSRAPEATALVYGERRIPYGELNARANQLAHVLRVRGVGRDTLVAVAVERGIEMIVALLGVLKAGGAYVPMAPDAPAERLAFMLSDAKPLLLLTDAATRFDEAGIDIPVISLDTLGPQLGQCPQTNPGGEGYASSQLAYVIYTSGTTGTPKGVLVSQRNLVNFCHWCQDVGLFKAGERMTQFAPFTFDASAGEIFGALLAGAELHLLDEATIHDPAALQRYLTTHAIQFSAFPPAYLQQMDPDAAPAGFKLLTAGSAPTPALVKRWAGRGHYLNGYGPTETTILSTSTWLSAEADTITIGRPIANTQVYLLDAHRQPVPIGAIGEIHIGGAGVALGYLNRPELTAELFLDDPFSAEADARMYRTGDLGRWMADGTIEFLGRNDFQVKIRGFRIELGEIEASLAGCEGVDEAVVIAREDGPGEPQLVAYYLGDQDVAAGSLREHLSKRLPEYMLPSAFVRLETWPLTTNGKLDRKALPVPGDDAYARRAYAAPEGEIEQALARIWSELLGIERIGRDDDFFELGGHSLLAVQLMSRLHNAFHVEVPLRAVFESPTLSQLTEKIEQADASQLSAIAVVEREAHMPLSLAQQRLWVLTQIDGASAAYHMGGALKLEGALDRPALERAFQYIVDRHEALRTRFVLVDGQPMQAIMAEARIAPTLHDLRGQANRDIVCRELNDAFMAKPFDLRHDLPLRVQLIQLEASVHELQVVVHHIVSDGWSIGIILSELSRLYAADVLGRIDPLPALPIQYVDYSQWQRQWLAEGQLARQIAFWQHNLAGAPTLLELPTDRRRPAQQDFAGDVLDVRLDTALTADLKALSQRHGVTLYMTLLASWAAMLCRLSNQDEVVIGSPVAGRNRAEIESLIGFFVNTVAFRIDLSGEPTTSALLARTKRQVLEAQAHQDLPFDQVVDAVKPPRSMAHAPIFQAMLAWQNQAEARLEMPGLALSSAQTEATTAKFDVTLNLQERDEEIVGGLSYMTALFDRGTVARYAQYWIRLLQGMATDPALPIARLPMLDERERECVLDTWNQTAKAYPRDLQVHALFEAQAARTPEAIALSCGERQMSYAELDHRANRLAHHLRESGVGPEDRIAICMERSFEMVVGLLGVLKAGGAYVPMDPASPQERLAYMIRDSAPVAILSHSSVGDRLSMATCPVLLLDTQWTQIAERSQATPQVSGLVSSHLAYVIYTSGSTGQPKGVMVEHHGLNNYLRWALETYAQGRAIDAVVSSPLVFDATITSLYIPLISGGCAKLIRDGDELAGLESLLSTSDGFELIKITPAHLAATGQRLASQEIRPASKLFVVGGEALPATTVAQWRELSPDSTIVNEYGPTETVVGCVVHDTSAGGESGGNVPIGRPIANTRIYILDSQRQPVPMGVVGELYIGGAGVARGYLNQPGLTAERFLDDPFSAEPAARMYRTGDLGRWLPDGNIEYLGRNDFQVKIRGFRIELGEIEAALAACEGVREAAVIAREDSPGEKRLVAYYIADTMLDAGDLRQRLSQHLPEYMLPAAFVRMEAWPLTSNGKLDRKALPAPEGDAYASRGYEAPQGEVETALARIWSELLRIERIGRYDHFFELGGHSLLAVQLISRLHNAFHVEVPLRAVFESPTLSQLADRIAQADASQLSAIAVVERETFMPLSLAQQRLWVLTQIDGASAAYHMGGALKLEGTLDRDALQRALQRIVDRHEALRTQFVLVDGQPMQAIMAEARIVPSIHDLRGRVDREAACRSFSDAFMTTPFDLRHDLPLRVQLIQLEDHVHELQVVMHHIVSDGWSIGIMLNELSRLYAADVQGQADPLPALPIQYVDYSQWQRQWLADGQLARQTAFWQHNLAGAPTLLELPTDRRRPAQQDFAGDAVEVRLDTALTAGLKALSQRHGVTLYMTLLASWAAVLGRLSNQDDVVIGSPVAGRNRAEIESLIGFFVNTVAFRIDLSGEPTTSTLLSRTQRQVLDAQAHQDLPFDQVVDAVKPPRSMAHAPIFQTMMTLNNQESAGLEMPGLEVSSVDAEAVTAKFDVMLDLQERDGKIVGGLSYVTALFDRETVARYAQYWIRLLQGMVAEPELAVSRLPMLNARERERVIGVWNQTAKTYPRDLRIHALFEAQVERTPEAIALSFGDQRLSYAELNRRANRVAHHLRAQGVKPDDRVAICTERSPEMVVAVLAVLKSGGAYVPLDPAFPRERLGQIIEDSTPVAALVDTHGQVVLEHSAGAALAGIVQVEVSSPRTFAECPEENLEHWPATTAAMHTAYVLFTSGSTGRPKGVCVSHRAAVNFLLSMAGTPGLRAEDTLCAITTLSFDIALLELLLPLTVGARVALADRATTIDAEALSALLEATETTVMQATPTTWRMLLDAGWRGRAGMRLLCGGEALPLDLAERLLTCGELWNMYGPTETTVWSMVERVVPGQSRITLGRPIANTRIYLLDARRQAVPIGVVGEIHIGGDGVALGYLGRPELTAERFLDDPFSVEPDARMYRTGDLGRWLPDGTVEFLGRNDFQVKIRGFRIELGEIEATLSACPGVREAVVSAREDAPGDQRLVAYYLADTMLDAGDLRRLLSQHLPEYMLPAAFVRLEAWPLTSNGKLDRKALPAPEGDAYASRGYEAPQGRVETALARIWSELLGIDRVGRHDNFFDLGGNSIQLIRMIARLCDQRIRISLADVYRLGTVHGIAAVAVSASQTLAERLAEEGWPYELVTVGAADTGIAVLLVDAREPARLAKLRRLLSDEAAAEVAYVRVSADPLAEAERLRLHGLAASEIQTGIASTALAATLGAQLDRQRAQIEAAATVETATVETYPFSAIQRNFQVWSTRDSIAHATAIGWYAPEALQAAFAALVREQDLLRSAADLPASRWRLLDAAAIGTALLPSIRLRPEPGLPVDAVFAQTLEVLTDARSRSPLAYAGAWISLSETEHHLCLSIDHLIWDGISEETLQRRLNALLREQSTPLVGSYRQFATEVECHGDRAIDARFDRRFDRAVVAATMAATSAVLAQRTALPLRSVTLSMPLTATHSPAEQAFECFRRWALRITALDRLGLVLTHHGRQRGAHGYFDHIGLFLDKIPFSVDIDTTLQTLTDTVGELQKQGLGYVAMERRACADGLMPTLPMISDEVLFNFQSRTMAENVDMPASSPQDLGARMGGYRGILFEGFAQSRRIIGNCLFRGSDEDMQALVDAFQGCTVIESMVVLTTDTPSPAMRAFDIATIE